MKSKQKLGLVALVLAFVIGFAVSNASATTIVTADGSGQWNGWDNYSYTYTIETTGDPTVFTATLTNTSLDDIGGGGDVDLIDRFFFNMDADLGTEFTIAGMSPDTWEITVSSGGVLFDYTGDPDSASDRLTNGDVLTWDFDFDDPPSLDIWSDAAITSGAGAGGGDEFGQFAVSFQTLGDGGEGSDLLVTNYEVVPEPTTMLLLGSGLVGLALYGRKRSRKKADKTS